MEIFGEYISGFMQVFLDDFTVLGGAYDHLWHIDYACKSVVRRDSVSIRQSARSRYLGVCS